MTARYLIVMALIAVAAWLQTSLLMPFSAFSSLDLIFVIVTIIGLTQEPVPGSIMAALAGYIEDILSSEISGLFMSARLTVFLAAQFLRVKLSPDSPLSQFSLGLALGIMDRIVVQVLRQVFTAPTDLTWRGFALMMAGTVINAALVPLFFFLFQLIPGLTEKPRGYRLPG
jgi:rod shape-determining protein MreD